MKEFHPQRGNRPSRIRLPAVARAATIGSVVLACAAGYAGAPSLYAAATTAAAPPKATLSVTGRAAELIEREVAATRYDGTAPATKPVVEPAVFDSLEASQAEYQGWKTFHVYCYRCHGVDAMGSDLAPNLRHSVSPEGSVTHEVFVQTVKEGRLPKGMPAWKEMLSDEQVENLYAYLKARSENRLAAGRPHLKKEG
jgi:mono/diheme cytochrome c family protein